MCYYVNLLLTNARIFASLICLPTAIYYSLIIYDRLSVASAIWKFPRPMPTLSLNFWRVVKSINITVQRFVRRPYVAIVCSAPVVMGTPNG